MKPKKQIKIVGCDITVCQCRKCILTKKCYECSKVNCPNYKKRSCAVKTIEEWQRDILIKETEAHRVRPALKEVIREPKTAEFDFNMDFFVPTINQKSVNV
jgi:hypothetical protein